MGRRGWEASCGRREQTGEDKGGEVAKGGLGWPHPQPPPPLALELQVPVWKAGLVGSSQPLAACRVGAGQLKGKGLGQSSGWQVGGVGLGSYQRGPEDHNSNGKSYNNSSCVRVSPFSAPDSAHTVFSLKPHRNLEAVGTPNLQTGH